MGRGTFQERALSHTELQSNVPKLESSSRGAGERGPCREQREDFKEFPPSVTTHPISPSIREEI